MPHTHRLAKIYYHQLIYNNDHRQHTRARRARRHGHFHHHPRKTTTTTAKPSGRLTCRVLSVAFALALTLHLLQVVALARRVDGGPSEPEYVASQRAGWTSDDQGRAPAGENFQEFAPAIRPHNRAHNQNHHQHQHHRHRLERNHRRTLHAAVEPQGDIVAGGESQTSPQSSGKQQQHRYDNRKVSRGEQATPPPPPTRDFLSAAGRRLAQAAAATATTSGQRSKRHGSGGPNNPAGDAPFPTGHNPGDNAADRPVVATSKGLVRGVTQKIFTGKFVDAFLGVPFGQPPVGKYRFRHPQPVQPWPGELDASRMSNSCYQVNDTFFGAAFGGTSIWNANTPLDENCLHLNIWTPFAAANTVPSNGAGGGGGTNSTTSSNNNNNNNNNRFAPPQAQGRPVLVWIFGGGFYSGTPTLSLYEGGAMASEEELIVVSINYRVSALGFLYFGRPEAPGNAGLFDQLLALQWIQDEIAQFGGDPRRVTIFGESAGAVSISFHLLSPLSRNLFAQAILQSGAATCPWGHMDAHEIMANGFQLAATLGCPAANASHLETVIECLLRAHPMALVSQEVGQTQSSVLNFPFVPVVDGAFLLEPPAESLAKGNFKPAKLLLGSNNDEGNAFLIYMPEFSHCPATGSTAGGPSSPVASPPVPAPALMLSPHQDQRRELNGQQKSGPDDDVAMESVVVKRSLPVENNPNNRKQTDSGFQQNESKPCKPNEDLQLTRTDFIRLLREDLNPYAEHPLGKRAIVFEYSNWISPAEPASNYDALDKIVGDYYFTCHVNEFGLRYAQAGNSVYMYHFKQRSSISPWPKWMGVIHGDEINFVFGEPLNPAFNNTKKEVELSRRMMKYWANFARHGNPTPPGPQQQQHDSQNLSDQWPEYLPDRRQYFELHSEYIRVGRGPRAKQCAFWSHYLPQLLRTYGKNNQCPAKLSSAWPQLNLKSPFTGSRTGSGDDYDENDADDADGGLQEDDRAAMSLHRPRAPRPSSGLLASIPSFISVSLIVIVLIAVVVLAAAGGHSFYLAKSEGRPLQVPSWLASVWPPWGGGGGGSQAASSPNNHEDQGDAGGEGGRGGDASRPPASNRGGGGNGNAAT